MFAVGGKTDIDSDDSEEAGGSLIPRLDGPFCGVGGGGKRPFRCGGFDHQLCKMQRESE